MTDVLNRLTLGKLPLTYRFLFTSFLLVVGLGLCMAGAQIMLTHGMADGKPGLSMDDIVYSYYGNRSGSKLEAALTGKMKDKAPANVNITLIKWVRDGAKEAEWEKVEPLFNSLSTEIFPLSNSTICFEIDKPSPVPPNFLVIELSA